MSGTFLRKLILPSNISTYLSRTLIIITMATTFLIGGFLIVQQTLQFDKIIQKKRTEFIENQKIYIQEIVNNEIEYIRLQNETFKLRINSRISQNVNHAINTAEAIYQKYQGKRSDLEIKEMIITTISSLKFEQEYEDIFISTLDGKGVYYPRKPQFSDRDLTELKDSNGDQVIQNELNFLRTNDEGFLNYSVRSKINPDSYPNKKITFVKKFGHFNWYFGSKQYVDNYFPDFRNEIAEKLCSVRFRFGGYVFMNQTNGQPIVLDGKTYSGPMNLLTNADSARHNVFVRELKVVNDHPEGGFFYYKWNKINEEHPSEKCSYAKLFKDYDWIIGSGFYLEDINKSIETQLKVLRQEQKNSILMVLLILIALLFLEAFIIYRFNKKYNSDFDRFFNFFFSSQTSFKQLTVSELYFEEFKRAAVAANNMIRQREETESRLIEEEKRAKESDRLKSAFLANMSHEIRTPMNAIIGFSELLEDNSQDEADKAIFIKLVRQNGEILLNLINDIIDISKIEADLLTVKFRPVLLEKFLSRINEHYTESLALKKGAKVHFEIQNEIDRETTIMTDEIRLRQILDNLIGNAIKFTHQGSIHVEVKKENENIHFSVSDTGIGIPSDQQLAIFERFIQAEHNTKNNFGGTGLGLAISKNLIELLGGKIDVKSVQGQGSTFHFYIRTNKV